MHDHTMHHTADEFARVLDDPERDSWQKQPEVGMALALNSLGNTALSRGDYATARACYSESLTVRRALGDRRGMSASLTNLAIAAWFQEDPATRELHEQSLVLCREIGHKLGITASLNNLGTLAYERRDLPAAQSLYAESLALKREMGDTLGVAIALNNLGNVLLDLGDAQAAQARQPGLFRFAQIGQRAGGAQSAQQ